MNKLFGLKGSIAKPVVCRLFERFCEQPPDSLADWKFNRKVCTGVDADVCLPCHQMLAAIYGVDKLDSPACLLYSVESYYVAVLRYFFRYRFPATDNSLLNEPLFPDEKISELDNVFTTHTIDKRFSLSDGDLFGQLYENLFPCNVRRWLGEFFTPLWLADDLLQHSVVDDSPPENIVDPTCGSGVFLVAAARYLLRKNFTPQTITEMITGYDLNPVSVLTARVNLFITLFGERQSCDAQSVTKLDIERRDTLLLEQPPRFDLVIGNPPWINWDNLPATFRERTLPLWREYGLFNLDAKAFLHGGAKKEIASLFVYRAADKLLRDGGKLAMVLPRSVLQTGKAGEGFRRFHILPTNTPLQVLRVDDYTQLKPFRGVRSAVCTLLIRKGERNKFPVPLIVHNVDGIVEQTFEQSGGDTNVVNLSAWKVVTTSTTDERVDNETIKLSSYTAYLGANTGGANGVYWLEIIEKTPRGTLRVRNLADVGKRVVPFVETEIEPDLVYPLLRWKGVVNKVASPSDYIVIPQDPILRTGIDEQLMQKLYPLTYNYLKQFESQLRDRAAFQKLHRGEAPFYSMYNVGQQTFATIKVVWRRMDKDLTASVVKTANDKFLGERCIVPQETCALIPVKTEQEAREIQEKLNSETTKEKLRSISIPNTKGFGSPGILKFL